jgi:predicted nucleic acid-binding protein
MFADLSTVAHYAMVYQQLRAAGKMIPGNDMWIAALLIQHTLHHSTDDAHFDYLAQIPRA